MRRQRGTRHGASPHGSISSTARKSYTIACADEWVWNSMSMMAPSRLNADVSAGVGVALAVGVGVCVAVGIGMAVRALATAASIVACRSGVAVGAGIAYVWTLG